MSSHFGGVTLAIPSTDHDTDMLSDTARTDAEFEIDMDAPSVTGDQDDAMAEDFELDHVTNNGTFIDATDAEMIEQEFDDQRVQEAEMYDGSLDEDDQMYNIDFDQSSEPQDANDTTHPPHETVRGSTNPNLELENLTSLQDHANHAESVETHNNLLQQSYNEPDLFSNSEIGALANSHSKENEPPETNPTTTLSSPSWPEALNTNSAVEINSGISNSHHNVTAPSQPDPDKPDSGSKELAEEEDYLIDFDDEEDEPEHQTTEEAKYHNVLPQEGSETLVKDSTHSEIVNTADSTEQRTNPQLEIEKDDDRNVLHQGGEEETHEEYAEDGHDHEEYHNYTYDVIVEYGGNQLSLFPPAHQNLPETYLLQDHSLAEKSLSELFAACREILGSSISEHDVLEIDIPTFDLYIHEVS
jgi:hypothetical protein